MPQKRGLGQGDKQKGEHEGRKRGSYLLGWKAMPFARDDLDSNCREGQYGCPCIWHGDWRRPIDRVPTLVSICDGVAILTAASLEADSGGIWRGDEESGVESRCASRTGKSNMPDGVAAGCRAPSTGREGEPGAGGVVEDVMFGGRTPERDATGMDSKGEATFKVEWQLGQTVRRQAWPSLATARNVG